MILEEEPEDVERPGHEGPSTFDWGKCHPELFLDGSVNPTWELFLGHDLPLQKSLRQQRRKLTGSIKVKLKLETPIWRMMINIEK